jgi:glycosyltransferase involved in cell wall biosynthesis
VWLGRFPDADLPALYSAARLFVMPSLYEGGGLTMLEAMACGCPVIAAANTALPEYTADCGMLADPRDAESLRKAIQTLWADGELRADLRRRGLARAAGFTWERAAQGVRQILVHFAA